MKGVTLQWTSTPSRGEYKYSQSLHATETSIRSDLMGPLAHTQTSPLPFLTLLLCIQSSVTCDEMKKFVAVWDNRFLEQVKLCSERIPGKLKDYFPKISLL